jgi:hypothetical protein
MVIQASPGHLLPLEQAGVCSAFQAQVLMSNGLVPMSPRYYTDACGTAPPASIFISIMAIKADQ